MTRMGGGDNIEPAAGVEPRWLTAEESEAWTSMAALLLLLPGVLDAQLQRDAGLTMFEYLVLAQLSVAEDRTARMSELAEMTNGSLSRLSNVVSRLERRGWVTRAPDPTDGRYTTASLTDTGWRLVVHAAPGHVEAVRRFVLDPLTAAQQRTLRAIGPRVRRQIKRLASGQVRPAGVS